MNCTKCAYKLDANARFCSQCGTPVAEPAAEPSQDRAELRHITVMFCDLVESTQLSEALDLEDLREVVRNYQAVAGEVIERYHGHVAQYLGDGLLVYFGYPIAHDDAAHRSILAGVDILEAVARLDAVVAHARIAVRIGVHSGQAVLGEVGSHGRSENLALGTVPNIAARIQGLAEPGQLLLSAATRELLDDRFILTELGPTPLKGISAPIDVYRVAAVSRDVVPVTDTMRLTGRDEELNTFATTLALTRSGRGQVLLLQGEAGIGKSRLHREAQTRLWRNDETWLVARCFAYHENETLHPLLPLLRRTADLTPSDSGDEGIRKLETWLARIGHATPALRSFLADVLGFKNMSREEAQEYRSPSLTQLVEIVGRGASAQPTTLVVEDLQWADPSTKEFLQQLAAKVESLSLCLVLVGREKLATPWVGYAGVSIELTRLPPASALAFIDACVGELLPDALKSDIVLRAAGIPLFLEEIALGLAERSAEELINFDLTDIPNTLQDSLVARIDAFGKDKYILQSAALLGRNFNLEILHAVTGESHPALLDVLQQARSVGMVASDETDTQRYYFRQPLAQQVAYEMPLRRQRRRMHAEVVSALRERFPEEITQYPQNYARHLEGAENFTESISYYNTAGRQSVIRLATAEAVRSYHHALRLLDKIEDTHARLEMELKTRRGLSQPLTIVGGFANPELLHNYARLREVATELQDDTKLFDALSGLWGCYCVGGYREETHEVVDAIRELTPRLDDSSRSSLASWIGGATAFYAGSQREARPILLQCMSELPHGDALTAQNVLISPGGISLRLVTAYCSALAGYPARAMQILKEILSVCEGDPNMDFAVVHTLCHINTITQCTGDDPQIAIDAGQRVMALSNQVEMQAWYRFGDTHQRWGRAMLGDASVLDGMLTIATAAHEQEVISRGHSNLRYAQACLACGDTDEALRMIDEVILFHETNLSAFVSADAHCLRAEVLSQLNAPRSEIRAEYAKAQQIAYNQGSMLFERRALIGMVSLDRQSMLDQNIMARLRVVHETLTEGAHLPDYQTAARLLATA